MYRNIYMECYKSAVMEKNDIEFLLCHFNHAYSAMGSILNDIEYAIGRLLSNPTANNSRTSIVEQKAQTMVEKIPEKSKKILDLYQQQKPMKLNHQIRPNVVDKNNSRAEPKSATMQFDQMFKLSSKPKQAQVPAPPKQQNRQSAPTQNKKLQVEAEGDDILDHLFSKR